MLLPLAGRGRVDGWGTLNPAESEEGGEEAGGGSWDEEGGPWARMYCEQ